jgi:hypothetical protein
MKAPIEEKPEKQPILKVVDGDVVRKKKTLTTRIREMFFDDDSKSVFEYVIQDVLIPSAKDMINDAVSQGMERLIFGDSKRSNKPPTRSSVFGGGSNRVNYNRYSSSSTRREPNRPRSRSSHDFDDIIIPTRGEAEQVLERLGDIVDKYETASVRDLFELVGEEFHHTDEKWGWTDLREAHVRRVNNGYLLKLPPTEPID